MRLVIAGDGKEREALNQLTRKLNETSRILFIGRYNRNDVSQIFGLADAFVLVSQVEPFGVVYIEAQMCGLPCIGTVGQGADDIIDGSSGIKVPFGDVNALIDAMKALFVNKDKYNHQDIKRNCASKFSTHTVCQKIEDIYKNII